MKYVCWNEQGPPGTHIVRRVSVDQAVDLQKRHVMAILEYVYLNDNTALDDFLAVNWAWIEEIKE